MKIICLFLRMLVVAVAAVGLSVATISCKPKADDAAAPAADAPAADAPAGDAAKKDDAK